MFVLGVDIGSTSSKAVILDEKKQLIASAVVAAGTGSTGPYRALMDVLQKSQLQWPDISYTVATGYGRMSLSEANKQVSEISCHARGVHHLVPTAHTIIDIGGQDSKAIKISSDGLVLKFLMNDKCAAGTGRFLEVMARVLEVDVNDMDKLAGQALEVVNISSTCAVFAESEVISTLASGAGAADVAAGVHLSVAKRVAGLVTRVGLQEDVVITGGVAQNSGVVQALRDELKCSINVAPLAQVTGALGAALIAWEVGRIRGKDI